MSKPFEVRIVLREYETVDVAAYLVLNVQTRRYENLDAALAAYSDAAAQLGKEKDNA